MGSPSPPAPMKAASVGRPDADDGRRANAGQDARRGEGYEHVAEPLGPGQAHRERDALQHRVDGGEGGDGVAHDRQQRIEEERDDGRGHADAE